MSFMVSTPPSAPSKIEILGKGNSKTGAGAIQLYDIGNFSTTSALDPSDVLVFQITYRYNSGANAGTWYLDEAAGALSGNQITLASTSNYGIATCYIMKAPTSDTTTEYAVVGVKQGASEVSGNANTLNLNAAETIYIKFNSVTAKTEGYRWVAYIIKGGI